MPLMKLIYEGKGEGVCGKPFLLVAGQEGSASADIVQFFLCWWQTNRWWQTNCLWQTGMT